MTRKFILVHGLVFLGALATGTLILVFSRREGPEFTATAHPYFFREPFTCGQCHPDIYNEWVQSRHSFSAPGNNPFFQKIYLRAVEEIGVKAGKECLQCHAPVAAALEDWKLREKVSAWGISCDFCHSIDSAQPSSGLPRFVLRTDNIKRGPYADANPRGHQARFSSLHTESRFCLECHRDMLPGEPLGGCVSGASPPPSDLSTQCQDCHMPVTRRRVCTTKGIPERPNVYRHLWQGGRSVEMLRKAAAMEVERSGEGLEIRVRSTHMVHHFPAGPPFRLAAVKVYASDAAGNPLWENWKEDPLEEAPGITFARLLGDSSGQPAVFWQATQTLRDTRLGPGEVRIFHIRLSEETRKVRAELLYFLAPPSLLKELGLDDQALVRPLVVAEAELIW